MSFSSLCMLWRYFVCYLSTLILMSCSNIDHQEKNVSVDDIPDSVRQLIKIEDKNSIEYELLAYQASQDIIFRGRAYLTGSDSSRALKVLTVGTKLMPWRTDITSLRSLALETYVLNTKQMFAGLTSSCDEILERVTYLKQVAPDEFIKMKTFPKRCEGVEARLRYASVESSFVDLLNTKLPRDKDHTPPSDDLIQKLDLLVNKNTDFPIMDLYLGEFNVFYQKYKDYRVIFNKFDIDPNATSTDKFLLFTRYTPIELPRKEISEPSKWMAFWYYLLLGDDWRDDLRGPKTHKQENNIIYPRDWIVARINYCQTIKQLLEVAPDLSAGSSNYPSISCHRNSEIADILKTTDVLKRKFEEFRKVIFFEYGGNHRLDKSIDPDGDDDDFFPRKMIVKMIWEYDDRNIELYLLEESIDDVAMRGKKNGTMCNKESLKGLRRIVYEIDFYKTFLMYKSILVGESESIESWAKENLK